MSPCNCELTRGAAEHTGVLMSRLVPASLHTADPTSDTGDPGRCSRHLHCGLGWVGPDLQENRSLLNPLGLQHWLPSRGDRQDLGQKPHPRLTWCTPGCPSPGGHLVVTSRPPVWVRFTPSWRGGGPQQAGVPCPLSVGPPALTPPPPCAVVRWRLLPLRGNTPSSHVEALR